MQSDSSNILASIVHLQNEDGGWSYGHGSSWVEPTAYALLALRAARETNEQFLRGIAFLQKLQRGDGGWPPHHVVNQSTWVTAIALLATADQLDGTSLQKAREWLLAQSGRESGYVHRIRQWMLGARVDIDVSHDGWPWYPETAAWVAPTAFSILALKKANNLRPDPQSRQRVEVGRQFLLARACRDGGWNHGSTRALGYDVASYPETSGLALLALHGARGSVIQKGIQKAEEHFKVCTWAAARNWLRLGLQAHGRIAVAAENSRVFRTPIDAALHLIAQADGGIGVFLSE